MVINKYTIAGFCSTLIGNGLGRFAYIAIFPALIYNGWFSKRQAAILGASTLVGYVVGAYFCDRFVDKIGVRISFCFSVLVCSFAYLLCSFDQYGFWWFLFWRFLSGFGGAILMIVPPRLFLPMQDTRLHSICNGIIFSGVGMGAMLSGTFVPLFLKISLSVTWIVVGLVSLFLAIYSMRVVLRLPLNDVANHNGRNDVLLVEKNNNLPPRISWVLMFIYALNAVGYLPHTLFWVDYVVHDLHRSVNLGGATWATFGFGALLGPLLTGGMSSKIGENRTLSIGLLFKAIAVIFPVVFNSDLMLFASAFGVGVFTPGIASLMSLIILKYFPGSLHTRVWGKVTSAFAFSQALVGWLMATFSNIHGSYDVFFVISSLSLVFASIVSFFLPFARFP